MRLKSKAYWIVVFGGIIANILIFSYMSKNLEEHVYHKTLEKYNITYQELVGISEQQ